MTRALSMWCRGHLDTLSRGVGLSAAWRSPQRRHRGVWWPSFAPSACCLPSRNGGGGAWGQHPPPVEQHQLRLCEGLGCVPRPDAIAVLGGEEERERGEPRYLLQVDVSDTFSTAPFGAVWRGVSMIPLAARRNSLSSVRRSTVGSLTRLSHSAT